MFLYEAFTMIRSPVGHPCRPFETVEGLALAHSVLERLPFSWARAPRCGMGENAVTRTGLRAECTPFATIGEIEPLLAGLEATVFQSRFWLGAWLAHFTGPARAEPFLVTLRDPAGEVILALPLVRRRQGRLRVLEHPDLGVSDYAAPLLRRSGIGQLPSPAGLWALIRPVLPPADILRLMRLPPCVAGMPNLFHADPRARRDRLSGWRLAMPEKWEDYHAGLSHSQREKIGKSLRRLDKTGATIAIATTRESAHEALSALETMQSERVSQKGLDYQLDQPLLASFYHRLVDLGAETGETVLTRIDADGAIIAANFAVSAGGETVYLRLANRFGAWSRFSLGIIVTEFIIRAMHARGQRVFDFAMGNYEYKRRLGGIEQPLVNLVVALSPRGWPVAIAWHLHDRLRHSRLLRRLTGRDASPQEHAEFTMPRGD